MFHKVTRNIFYIRNYAHPLIRKNFLNKIYITNPNIVCSLLYDNLYSNCKLSTLTSTSPSVNLNEITGNLSSVLTNISLTISNKHKVYKNDVENALLYLETTNTLTRGHSLLLINCCSNLLVNETPSNRLLLLEKLYNSLKTKMTFDLDHYNEILKCYIDNFHNFNAEDFLDGMAPYNPSLFTYELIMKALCQNGDMEQTFSVLKRMKNDNMILSESIYNSLIEGYGKTGNMKAVLKTIDEVNTVIKNPSTENEKSIIMAYIYCKDENAVKDRLIRNKKSNIKFLENEIIEMIKCAVYNDMNNLLNDILSLFSEFILTTVSFNILHTCTRLIHQGYVKSAFIICQNLSSLVVGTSNIKFYLSNLIRDAIKNSDNAEDIKSIFKEFDILNNGLILNSALESALRYHKFDAAIELMDLEKQQNMPIRCHYFWPLFLLMAKTKGEAGIFDLLSKMNSLNVKPDMETFVDFVIPNVNTTDPQNLIKKFQEYGFNISDCLTPIVLFLLKDNEVKAAADLCELSGGKLDCEKLIPSLSHAFLKHYDIDSTHTILKIFALRPLLNNTDWIGRFLINLFSQRNWKSDVKDFSRLLLALSESDTKISLTAVEKCIYYLNKFDLNDDYSENIKKYFSTMIDKDFKCDDILNGNFHNRHIANMDMEQLEYHLIELESKGMGTRGVLRKLLQKYCQYSKIDEAKVILEKCLKENVEFSAGMKSSILNIYIKTNDAENAHKWYCNLKKTEPHFKIDDYKIIDLSTLLISNKQIDVALKILENERCASNNRGTSNIETNCWKLLNEVATNYDPTTTFKTLSLLLRLGFCKPTNIILGPLVRAHLNKSDIIGAVNEFINCSQRYSKTPLKHELLKIIVRGSSDYKLALNGADLDPENGAKLKNTYKELLMNVQVAEINVHGVQRSKISLIVALADSDLIKPLRRYFLESSTQIKHEDLIRQCQRFYDEMNVNALRNIAICTENVRNIQREEIYALIFKIYQMKDDFNNAIKIWNEMLDQNVIPNKDSVLLLSTMLIHNHQNVPHTLLTYCKKYEINV